MKPAVRTENVVDLFQYSRFSPVDWIIFDADNTLWNLEALYHDARDRLCRYLTFYGFDFDEVAEFQRRRDIELYSTYGRAPRRFPQSFIDTLIHFRPAPRREELALVWELAANVFSKNAEPYAGIADALYSLSKKARLAILTAGAREIQNERLKNFPYIEYFEIFEIVDAKTADTFNAFLKARAITPRYSWMIGDSLRADIAPAKEAGLHTIWVKSDNWSPIESCGLIPDQIADFSVHTILDAIELISHFTRATKPRNNSGDVARR